MRIFQASKLFLTSSFLFSLASCSTPNYASNDFSVTPKSSSFSVKNVNTKLPVLMVIGNKDFYYREFNEPKRELEKAGFSVKVAALRKLPCTPHANSGQGTSSGIVNPDLSINEVKASDYSTIVFVGGWGASMYQPAFTGTYYDNAYNSSLDEKNKVNEIINDFYNQNKYITALCHGVSVLAWSRVNGRSIISGKTVASYNGVSPSGRISTFNLPTSTRWHIEYNGATMVRSRSIGNPNTSSDDVIVSDKIITAEDYDSATYFGKVVAYKLNN